MDKKEFEKDFSHGMTVVDPERERTFPVLSLTFHEEGGKSYIAGIVLYTKDISYDVTNAYQRYDGWIAHTPESGIEVRLIPMDKAVYKKAMESED